MVSPSRLASRVGRAGMGGASVLARAFSQVTRWAWRQFDVEDVVVIVGLGLVAVGVARWQSRALACVVVGVACLGWVTVRLVLAVIVQLAGMLAGRKR